MIFIVSLVIFVSCALFLLFKVVSSTRLRAINKPNTKDTYIKDSEHRHAVLDDARSLVEITAKNPNEDVVLFRFVGLANVVEILVNLKISNEGALKVTLFKVLWDFWIEGLHIKSGTFLDRVISSPKDSAQPLYLREVLLDSQSSDVLWINKKEKTSGYLEGVAYFETSFGRFQKKFSLLTVPFSVVGEAKEKPKDTSDEANLDGLTGLQQRKYLEDNMQSIIDRNIHRAPVSFAMLDIDNFKKINDESGHLAGDEVLKTVCSIIRETLHNRAIAIRYGGDEIAIVMSSCAIDEAQAMMESIRAKVEKHEFMMEGGIVHATLSIGLAALTQQASYKLLVRTADNMLRFSKQNGKNRVSVNLRKIEPVD